jgi:hypothetical protein
MSATNLDRIGEIATGIKFKEYLLSRDIPSRLIIIDHCIGLIEPSSPIAAWFQNFRAITLQPDAKERKDQIRADAYWNDLILEHTKDRMFGTIMSWFMA